MNREFRDHFLDIIQEFHEESKPIAYKKKSVFFLAENEEMAKDLINSVGEEMKERYGFSDTLFAGTFLFQKISSKKYEKGFSNQKEEPEMELEG